MSTHAPTASKFVPKGSSLVQSYFCPALHWGQVWDLRGAGGAVPSLGQLPPSPHPCPRQLPAAQPSLQDQSRGWDIVPCPCSCLLLGSHSDLGNGAGALSPAPAAATVWPLLWSQSASSAVFPCPGSCLLLGQGTMSQPRLQSAGKQASAQEFSCPLLPAQELLRYRYCMVNLLLVFTGSRKPHSSLFYCTIAAERSYIVNGYID